MLNFVNKFLQQFETSKTIWKIFMFANSIVNWNKDTKNEKFVENYFVYPSDELDPIEFDLEDNSSLYRCLFKYIYRREGKYFIHSDFKVIVEPARGKENNIEVQSENIESSSLDLFRTLQLGVSQFDIIKNQIKFFNKFSKYSKHKNLTFELDLYEFVSNNMNLRKMRDIICECEEMGVSPEDIIIDISGVNTLDQGVVYAIAMELKNMGLRIGLINIDADCFSFKRVFQIWPHIVKFNRSWSDLPSQDPHYLDMVKTLVSAIHDKGIFTTLTCVRSESDLRFATHCGFNRCQGSYFGQPSNKMEEGKVFPALF